MFTLTPENHADLEKLNSTYGIRHRKGMVKQEKGSDVLVEKIMGDIHCLMSGKVYASAEGATETLAVQAAIEVAKTAPKPYTSSAEATVELRAENALLKKQLAEATNTPGTGGMPNALGDDADRAEVMRQLDEAGVEYGQRQRTATLVSLLEESKLSAAS